MKKILLRVAITAAVFAGTGTAANLFLINGNYDVYVEAIKFLASVIAAGCYWIGSNEK